MESNIKYVLVTFIENNNLITTHQRGFMINRSCLTNLLETLESWTKISDAGYGLDVIYLQGAPTDFSVIKMFKLKILHIKKRAPGSKFVTKTHILRIFFTDHNHNHNHNEVFV